MARKTVTPDEARAIVSAQVGMFSLAELQAFASHVIDIAPQVASDAMSAVNADRP